MQLRAEQGRDAVAPTPAFDLQGLKGSGHFLLENVFPPIHVGVGRQVIDVGADPDLHSI
jgi:hypothetical protein